MNYKKLAVILVPVVVALVVIVIVLLTRGPVVHANKFPPYESVGYTQQITDIGRERYIVADLQLAGAMDAKQTNQNLQQVSGSTSGGALAINGSNPVYKYYINYINDPVVSNALDYFSTGDIVINIYQFDRIDLGDLGWQVVYGGTQTVVNALDFVMASDIGGLADEEARIRYILADAQLGNVIDYYRQYLDQPAVRAAVERWDAGVRVINIDQFERRIAREAGWKVVYLGTDITINGMDVILSEEPGGLNLDYCQNSYWPIVEGATWQYHRFSASVDNGDIFTDTITARQYNQFTFDMGGAEVSFYCQQAGIHVAGQPIQLPSEANLYAGYQLDAYGIITSVTGYETVTVPAGTFDTIVITYTLKSEDRLLYTFYYAQGIGIIKEVDEDLQDIKELVGYDIPGVGAVAVATPEPETNVNYCDNPYWPILEGAYWIYEEDAGGGTVSHTFQATIQDMLTSGGQTFFTVYEENLNNPGNGHTVTYTCTPDGIFDASGHYLLPFNRNFQHATTYAANGQEVTAYLSGDLTVPAGTFQPVRLCWGDFYVWCFSFAEGIGPVQGNFNAMDWVDNLVSYYIPETATEPGTALAVQGEAGVCNNPYWPIVEGATWTYYSEYGVNSVTTTWSIVSITSDEERTYFTILKSGSVDTWTTEYYCDDTGIYQMFADGQPLKIPPAELLTQGYTWGSRLDYGQFTVEKTEAIEVPAGNFDALKIQGHYTEASAIDYYANGVGLVYHSFQDSSGEILMQLISYDIPGSSIASAALSGYIAYPSEGWCPEIGLYARNLDTDQETYLHWNDGQCGFSLQVPAPGNYILYAWSLDPAYPFGFLYSTDCMNAIPLQVYAGSVISNIALSFCPDGNVPTPINP